MLILLYPSLKKNYTEYTYEVLGSCCDIIDGASYFSRKHGRIHHLERYY